jgi:hypothetical protein
MLRYGQESRPLHALPLSRDLFNFHRNALLDFRVGNLIKKILKASRCGLLRRPLADVIRRLPLLLSGRFHAGLLRGGFGFIKSANALSIPLLSEGPGPTGGDHFASLIGERGAVFSAVRWRM